ncbi:MAG: cytochrome c oxidase subunit 3 [bacterium]|nr:cytochrome c oxidase subunit 3 [bacterium]
MRQAATTAAAATVAAHAPHKDYEGAKTGMWIFLFTELLLFGGLFLIYAVYRTLYTHDFHLAAMELNVPLGVTNTFVLLTSSLTMVLAVTALQKGDRASALNSLFWTIFLAGVFLVIKFFEWSAKFVHGLNPGAEHLKSLPAGEGLFYGLYFVMTGLHGFHVVVGMVLLTVIALQVKSGRIHQGDFVKLENAGLYWHLVDLVWIFLLPLFYLTN